MDRRLERSTTEVKTGGIDAAVLQYNDSSTPDLIVVESSGTGEDLVEKIDSLADVCDPGTQVMLLGNITDVAVYRALMQQGVSDCLIPPYDSKQIFSVIEAICAEPSERPLGRVISFMGSKGGVGSSTMAHNVAWCLAEQFSDDVAVLDLDIAFGTLALAFNVDPQQGVADALVQPDRVDEMLLERFMAKQGDHINLLIAPGSLDSEPSIDIESFDVLLNLIRRTAPFVVIDLPHTWAPWTRHILMGSDEIVVTSTLDLAALRDTKSLYDNLAPQRQNDEPMRIVVNHVGAYRKTELSVKDYESAVGVDPTLAVVHDPVLFGTASNNGQMVPEVNKRSKVSEGLRALALTVSNREAPKKSSGGGGFSLFSKKGKE